MGEIDMFSLTTINPQSITTKIIAFLLWTFLCLTAGYLYKWHRVSVELAAQAATQNAAQTTTDAAAIATDTVQIDTLTSKLAAAKERESALQRRIAELSNAKPAALTCRLPDGLRESINADLATNQR